MKSRAYLTTEATVARRVVRAKRTLTEAGAAIEEPSEAERAERLTTLLSVIYLLYNEGCSATAGSDWTRPALCDEVLRLGGSSPRSLHGRAKFMDSVRSWSCSRPA